MVHNGYYRGSLCCRVLIIQATGSIFSNYKLQKQNKNDFSMQMHPAHVIHDGRVKDKLSEPLDNSTCNVLSHHRLAELYSLPPPCNIILAAVLSSSPGALSGSLLSIHITQILRCSICRDALFSLSSRNMSKSLHVHNLPIGLAKVLNFQCPLQYSLIKQNEF